MYYDDADYGYEADYADDYAEYMEGEEMPDMEVDRDYYPGEDMDGDFDSGMSSAGFGTDEDYNHYDYGDDCYGEY